MARNIYLIALLFAASLLFSECKSNVADAPVLEVKPAADKYLVSYNGVRTVTKADVSAMYSPVQSIYPDVASILPNVKSGVRIFSVTYNTTFGTKPIVASGLVCLPDAVGTYPILSFQNGTNTVYANAPSLNAYNLNVQLITGFTSTGFIVVIPDYLGFGSSTSVFHPYLHLESTVIPILDLFRAVKELCAKTDLNVKLSQDLYLMGYSQGGLSTLQLQKSIETSYSSEFNLKAVGCGAGPYNLPLITETVVGSATYSQPYYIAYILKGFRSAGAITNPNSDLFNEPFASRMDGLFNGINSGGTINDQLSANMAELFTSEFRTTYTTNAKFKGLRDALLASSVAAWRIKTPLILTHGQADTDVTPLMTKQLYDDLMKTDPTLPVTYLPMAGLNHGSASAPSLIYFVKQFLILK